MKPLTTTLDASVCTWCSYSYRHDSGCSKWSIETRLAWGPDLVRRHFVDRYDYRCSTKCFFHLFIEVLRRNNQTIIQFLILPNLTDTKMQQAWNHNTQLISSQRIHSVCDWLVWVSILLTLYQVFHWRGMFGNPKLCSVYNHYCLPQFLIYILIAK